MSLCNAGSFFFINFLEVDFYQKVCYDSVSKPKG